MFWKYLGSIFTVVVRQLLPVWEVSLMLLFWGRSGALSFGWTIFLRSCTPSPRRNLPSSAGFHSSHSFPHAPQATGLQPLAARSFCPMQEHLIPRVQPTWWTWREERSSLVEKEEERNGKGTKGADASHLDFFFLVSLCLLLTQSGPPRAAPLLGLRITALG